MNRRAQALVESLFVMSFGVITFFIFMSLAFSLLKQLHTEHRKTQEKLQHLQIQNEI